MTLDLTDYLDVSGIVLREERGSSGPQLVCSCPFCGRPKLYVAAETGLWICYRCDKRGNATSLIMEIDGVTRAVAKITLSGIREIRPLRPLSELLEEWSEAATQPVDETAPLALPDEFVPVFDGRRWRMPRYLTDRGFKPALAQAYGVGCCSAGRYAGRIIIPAYGLEGNLLTFQGRAIDNRQPKYLSAPVKRGQHLLGLHRLRPQMTLSDVARVAVVEGPFDVLGCARAGIPAVAVLGKTLSARQIVTLQRLEVEVVIMLDAEACDDAARMAEAYGAGASVAVLREGDPGEVPGPLIREAFRNARPPTRFGALLRGR